MTSKTSQGQTGNPGIFIFDPGLKELQTHHYLIDANLNRAISYQGLTSKFFSHRDFDPVLAEFHTIPTFRFSPYADTPTLDERDFVRQWRTYAQDIDSIVKFYGNPEHLLIHTATPALIQGLAVAVHLHALRCRSIRLQLMFHPLSLVPPDITSPSKAHARYLVALRMLQGAARQVGIDLQVSTSCRSFADLYSKMLQETIPVHPYALHSSGDPSQFPPASSHLHSARKILLFSGNLKLDKGIGWIAEALPQLLGLDGDTEFHVQLSDTQFGDNRLKAAVSNVQSIAAASSRVKVHGGYIGAAEWAAKLASMDAFLIPYTPYSYRYKTSGILFEYLKFARPSARIFVTSDTWLSHECAQWRLPITSVNFGDTYKLSNILASLDSFPAIGNICEDFAEFWKEFFGQGNDAFLTDRLSIRM